MFWLAWQACGGPLGMGVLQDHPSASEDEVWNRVIESGDYAMNHDSRPWAPYGDYVFGRMMKLGLTIYGSSINVPDQELRSDYQAWAVKYPTYPSLLDAAATEILHHGKQEHEPTDALAVKPKKSVAPASQTPKPKWATR